MVIKSVSNEIDIESIEKLNIKGTTEMSTSRIILWLRNDLRLHDNYVMKLAMQICQESDLYGEQEILPVFCFDGRIYNKGES